MLQEPAVPTLRRRRRWLACAVVLLAAHLLLGIGRLPDRVFARRAADIERYRDGGAAPFLLGNAKITGADEIDWLRRHVAPDGVVLWRGDAQGAMEFVPALLAPTLVVRESAVAVTDTAYRGRPLLRAQLPDGQEGIIVVEGKRNALALHAR